MRSEFCTRTLCAKAVTGFRVPLVQPITTLLDDLTHFLSSPKCQLLRQFGFVALATRNVTTAGNGVGTS